MIEKTRCVRYLQYLMQRCDGYAPARFHRPKSCESVPGTGDPGAAGPRIDGVRYDELAPMLLNDMQQQQRKMAAQEWKNVARSPPRRKALGRRRLALLCQSVSSALHRAIR